MFETLTHSSADTEERVGRKHPSSVILYCRLCSDTTQHLDVTDAASLLAVSRYTVYRWMKRNSIHWASLPCGIRVVCEKSLSEKRRSRLLMRLLPLVAMEINLPDAVSRRDEVVTKGLPHTIPSITPK
jgi:predicted site-specific integrase-resolvase